MLFYTAALDGKVIHVDLPLIHVLTFITSRTSADTNTWRPVIHRDIKVENIFVMSLGGKKDLSDIVVKLGDFGLASYYDPSMAKMPGRLGTALMWPPEQTWENREATPAGDVWAVGSVIHELAHGFPPVVDPELTKKAWSTDVPFGPTWSKALRESFWDAKSERRPIPINLEKSAQESDTRRRRPTPKYSDRLNVSLMAALEVSVEERATACELKNKLAEEHVAFLFDEMQAQNEVLQNEDS